MALADDIAALIVTPAAGGTSFLPDQAVLHAAAKSHELRLLTPTAVQTAAYTAAAGQLVQANATTASLTVTLPAATAGLRVAVTKVNADTSVNTITVAPAGTDTISGTTVLRLPGEVRTYTATAGQWVMDGGATTLTSTDNRYVPVFTPEQYGAMHNGTDDSTAIRNAILAAEAAGAGGVVVFGPHDYAAASTIVIKNCDVDAPSGARIISSAPIAVQLGTPTQNLTNRTLRLPQLLRIGSSYGTGVGLQLTWANANEIHIPTLYRFADGLVLNGDGTNGGYVYGNTFHLGILTSDSRNIVFGRVNGGFSTQCTFIGGIYNFGVTGARVAGTRQVVIGDATTNVVVGQHTFIGCDFESLVAEYLMDCYDQGSTFYNCRWETNGTRAGYIRWLDDGTTYGAAGNVIDGGWAAELLNVVSSPLAKNNVIRLPGGNRASTTVTAANLSLTNTVPAAVGAPDLTLHGMSAGQTIAITAAGHWDAGAPYIFADAALVVGTTVTNYASSTAGFTTPWGMLGWGAVGGVETFFGGTVNYVLKPGDVSAVGDVIVRLSARLNSAGTRVLAASTNVPLTFSVAVVT